MMNLKFYRDAGHGWLAVKKSVLTDLGILDKISTYSYESPSGGTVYLEEDRDASLFLNAAKAFSMEFPKIEVDSGERSFIRSYRRFSPQVIV
jgi:hypothetical protein